MLADDQALAHLPLADIWEWQVGVACRQTGSQRLKAIHLLLRILQCPTQWYVLVTALSFSLTLSFSKNLIATDKHIKRAPAMF